MNGKQLYEALRKFANKNDLVPAPEMNGITYPSQSLFYCTWDQLYAYERSLFNAVAEEICKGRSESPT